MIELGSFIAGPFAGRLLGDMGAEVIKVEAPGRPDPLREWGRARYRGTRRSGGRCKSRNKKCITLDLRTARGQELLLALVERSRRRHRELPPGHARALEPRLRALHRGEPRARPRARLRLRADRPVRDARGLRRRRRGDGRPAPHQRLSRASRRRGCSISLGDSLAGMFAVQGILAALYWRDAARRRRGQVVDVSLLESCFAMLESTVPEYDRLGLVREPAGTQPRRHRAVEPLQSRDGQLGRDRREPRHRSSAGCARRWAGPSWPTDARFAIARRARRATRTRSTRIVAAWAGAARRRRDRRACSTTAGVVCGPSTRSPTSSTTRSSAPARCSSSTTMPSSARTWGRASSRSCRATPGSVRWSAHLGAGQPQRRGLRRAARARRARARRAASEGVIVMTRRSRSVDVAPRDGLQIGGHVLEPGRSRRARPPSGGGGRPRASRSASFVNAADACRRWRGAEEVVAASSGRADVAYSALVLNERGYDAPRRDAARRRELRRSRSPTLQPAQPGPDGRGRRSRRRGASSRARTRRRQARRGHVRRRVRLPVRGRVDPAGSYEVARPDRSRPGADELILADTIGVAAPTPGARARGRLVPLGHADRRPPARHPQHRVRERATPRSRPARRRSTRRRRHRRLPVRAARDGQHRDGGSRLPARREGIETGIDLDALIGVAAWLETSSAGNSRVRSIAPAAFLRPSPPREPAC